MNILVTSAGRRTSLVRAFQEAAHPRGGRVFAGDMDPLAPALYLADDAFPLPEVTSPRYVTTLLSLLREHDISLVVPTIDPELPVLAKAAGEFYDLGCRALVSGPDLTRVAADKWLTVRYFSHRGIRTPRSWLPRHARPAGPPYQLFVKPRRGSGSRDAMRVSARDLDSAVALVPNPMIQEFISAPEITVDALLGFDGTPIHFVPRLRIKTVGGESVQGVTIRDDRLSEWLLRVLTIVGNAGGLGPVTLQAFLTDDEPTLSEINPRFGGGFPLTNAAGGHYAKWVLGLLSGEEIPARMGTYRTGLHMTRCYVEHFPEAPLW